MLFIGCCGLYIKIGIYYQSYTTFGGIHVWMHFGREKAMFSCGLRNACRLGTNLKLEWYDEVSTRDWHCLLETSGLNMQLSQFNPPFPLMVLFCLFWISVYGHGFIWNLTTNNKCVDISQEQWVGERWLISPSAVKIYVNILHLNLCFRCCLCP